MLKISLFMNETMEISSQYLEIWFSILLLWCFFAADFRSSGLLRKKDIRDMRTSTTHMGSSYKINWGTTDSNVSRYCISLQILTQNLMRASNLGNFRGRSGNESINLKTISLVLSSICGLNTSILNLLSPEIKRNLLAYKNSWPERLLMHLNCSL